MIEAIRQLWRMRYMVPDELTVDLLRTINDASDPEAAARSALLGARERVALEQNLRERQH